MIIDCISDLHGFYPTLEGGDLLIVAGDLTARHGEEEFKEFLYWIEDQNYKKKVVIAGNHDSFFEHSYTSQFQKDEFGTTDFSYEYLCDSGTEFTYYDERFPKEDEGFLPSGKRTLKIWGSPWTAVFDGINPKCMAFTMPYGCDTDYWLDEHWSLIPSDIDILVTHCPPYGYFDTIYYEEFSSDSNHTPIFDKHTGSISLRNHVMNRIKPKLHVFGHIHECGGSVVDTNVTKFVNASYVNENYKPVNKPIRVIL